MVLNGMKITAGLLCHTARWALLRHQFYIPPYAHSPCFLTQNLSHKMPWRSPDEISMSYAAAV